MKPRYMILPSDDFNAIHLIQIPNDLQGQAAYRSVTSIIAQVEEDNPEYEWSDLEAALESHGFAMVEFQLGPMLS